VLVAPPRSPLHREGRPHINTDLRKQRAAGQNQLVKHLGLFTAEKAPYYEQVPVDQPQRPPFKRAADAVALGWWVQASIGGGASAMPVPVLGRFTIRPLGV